MIKNVALSGVLVVAMSACASAGEPLAPPDPTIDSTAPEDTTSTTEEPTLQTTPPSDPQLLALAEEARSDLAQHLGVTEGEIAVTSAAAVTWNDGSMGCPEPGMSYTQALVDGARVTLQHDGEEYAYHQGGGELFLCQEPAEGSYAVSGDDSGSLQMTPPPGFND